MIHAFDYGDPAEPLIRSVFHPSDFSVESAAAFAHALAIAVLTKSRFTVLNAARGSHADQDWDRFPAVRRTLERWGLLEEGSPRSAVFERTGVKVTKVLVKSRNPVRSTLDWIDDHAPDLVVLASGGSGLPGWLDSSLAGELAGRARARALFVPAGARGFVRPDDGHLSLKRLLVPVATSPDPAPGLVAAYRLARRMGDGPAEITVAHVGDEDGMPAFETPSDPQVYWRREVLRGDVIDAIAEAALQIDVDAIVMPVDGRNGVLDVLRGSHSERLLRRTRCPIATVPS